MARPVTTLVEFIDQAHRLLWLRHAYTPGDIFFADIRALEHPA
jgi:hypothetical protein